MMRLPAGALVAAVILSGCAATTVDEGVGLESAPTALLTTTEKPLAGVITVGAGAGDFSTPVRAGLFSILGFDIPAGAERLRVDVEWTPPSNVALVVQSPGEGGGRVPVGALDGTSATFETTTVPSGSWVIVLEPDPAAAGVRWSGVLAVTHPDDVAVR